MTRQLPIAPPPELVEEWIEIAKPEPWKRPPDPNVLATLAAQWGYEQCYLDIENHALHSIVPPTDLEPESDE